VETAPPDRQTVASLDRIHRRVSARPIFRVFRRVCFGSRPFLGNSVVEQLLLLLPHQQLSVSLLSLTPLLNQLIPLRNTAHSY
jgi:hypothetical protein